MRRVRDCHERRVMLGRLETALSVHPRLLALCTFADVDLLDWIHWAVGYGCGRADGYKAAHEEMGRLARRAAILQ